MDKPSNNHRVLSLLQALNKAAKTLQTNPIHSLCRRDLKPAIEAISELGKQAETALSCEPRLSNLSQSLTNLKTLFVKLEKLHGRSSVAALFRRLVATFEVSEIAHSIEAQTNSIVDTNIVENLLSALTNLKGDSSLEAAVEFRNRLSRGFDREFQELLLRGRVFDSLELVLSSDESLKRRVSRVLKDQAALTILALVEFNKDVFVGLVLMGPTIPALISVASVCTMQVLWSLIGRVKTILVEAIEVPRMMSLLDDSGDVGLRVAAMNVALEMAYFGSRETVEAMIVGEGLVKKLMDLQREMERVVDEEEEEEEEVRVNLARGNCAVRLAVQVEVSESLDKREKRELRSEILRFVGDYSDSECEFVSLVSEVLWGFSSSL